LIEFQLDTLTEEDVPAALALWQEAFGELKPEDAPERLARTLRANPGLSVAARAQGRLVGSVIATTDGRRGFLYHVAVAAPQRRRGIAAALVREAVRRLLGAGLDVVHLRVEPGNAAARSLYRSLGFTEDAPVLGMRFRRPA
jgi:ribosomal protein S18 acetylase RimI-like enzyme